MRCRSVISESPSVEMNMTPMIDVIFQLLIFFLCTSNFIQPENLLPTTLALPGSIQSAESIPPELQDIDEIVIELYVQPQLGWRMAGMEYESLEAVGAILKALASTQPDAPIILDVSGDVPLGRVIDLYDLCRLCGLNRIQFAAGDPQTI